MEKIQCFSDIKNAGKIKSALKYAESLPITSKFVDIKTRALDAIREDSSQFNLDAIDIGNTRKLLDAVSKTIVQDSRVIDLTNNSEYVEGASYEFLHKLLVIDSDYKIEICINQCVEADVYLYVSRGNNITMKGLSLQENSSFVVQNFFNCYGYESFTLAIKTNNIWVAIEPAEAAGMKGSGEVYVYIIENGRIYKDLASKYFECSAILKVFRG